MLFLTRFIARPLLRTSMGMIMLWIISVPFWNVNCDSSNANIIVTTSNSFETVSDGTISSSQILNSSITDAWYNNGLNLPPTENSSITDNTTIITKPSPPLNFTVRSCKSTSVLLEWSSDDDTVKEFSVKCDSESTNDEAVVSSNTTEHFCYDLEPFTNYTSSIKSSNGQMFSDSVYTEFTTKYGKPEGLDELIISDITSRAFTVRWNNPQKPNGPLNGFKLLLLTNEIIIQEWNTESLNQSFTGLSPYTEYKISLRAYNNHSSDDIQFSESVENYTRTYSEEPKECDKFTIASKSANSILATWSEPKVKNGPIDGYVISWQIMDESKIFKSEMLSNSSNEFEMKELKAYTDVEVELFAFNTAEDGTGNMLNGTALALQRKTYVSEPKECDKFTIASKSANSILATWSEPKVKNGPIDGYVISWQIMDESKIFKSEVLSNSSNEFEMKELKAYTDYEVELFAFNTAEDGTGNMLNGTALALQRKTYVSEPGKCDNFILASKNATTILATWNEPTVKNGPIDGYIISWQIIDESKSSQSEVLSNSSKDFEIKGLKPYTDYEIKLLAFNTAEDGTGDKLNGPALNQREKTDVSEPGKCDNFILAFKNSTSILATWNEPTVKNGPIDGYIISWQIINENKSSQSEVLSNSSKDFEIKGLKPYTDYEVKLFAFNMAEDGTGNKLNGPTLNQREKTDVSEPDGLDEIKIEHITSKSFIVTWSKPRIPNGLVDGYQLVIKFENGTQVQSYSIESIKQDVNGLAPYTEYIVSLRAFNNHSSGEFLYSQACQNVTRTFTDIPSLCEDFTTEQIGSSSLTVSWNEPIIKNGPVDGYILSWKSDNQSELTNSIMLNNSWKVYNIDDLMAYSDYDIELFAYNLAEDGSGEKLNGTTSTILQRTDVSFPSEARNLTLFFNETTKTVLVNWIEPENAFGPIDGYNIIYQQEQLQPLDSESSLTPKRAVTNQTTFEFMVLHWRTYVITISVFNINNNNTKLEGYQVERNISTPLGNPIKPSRVNVETSCRYSIVVSWLLPLLLTGPTTYVIEISEAVAYYNEECADLGDKWGNNKSIFISNWNSTRKEIENLKPAYCYRVNLVAVVQLYEGELKSSSDTVISRTQEDVPKIPRSYLKLIAKNSTSVTFFIPSEILYHSNGRVQNYAIIVQLVKDADSNNATPITGEKEEEEKFFSWQAAKDNSSITKYRASPFDWKPSDGDSFDCTSFVLDERGMKCILGAQFNCTGIPFCNGFLQSGTSYSINVRKYTKVGFADSMHLIATTDKISVADKTNSGAVAASLSVVLVLILLTVGVFLAYRRGYLQQIWPPWKLKRRHSDCVSMNPIASPKSKPIRISEFNREFQECMANSCIGFAGDFEKLKNISPDHPKEIGGLVINKSKNRYINIIPFDHTRVKLLPVDDDDLSDYINASFIPGAHWTKEYIASQGPLPGTVNDFWRMVWENQTQLIVMVTQCTERGRAKCEEYWPKDNKGKTYGDLLIKLDNIIKLPLYTIRQFSIILTGPTKKNPDPLPYYSTITSDFEFVANTTDRVSLKCLTGKTVENPEKFPKIENRHGHLSSISCIKLARKRLRVSQMHYTRWPDMGSPDTPDDLINFVRAVRDQVNVSTQHTPMLVHCSAGVGRTGTFITVDRLMFEIEEKRSEWIDVFGTVLDLRNNRISMVQTEDQYVYIHQCINRIIEENNSPRTNGNENFDNTEAIYANM